MDTFSSPTLNDDLKQVLAEVPPPIRAFIASGKVQVIAKNLMQKNQLHIDQGAIIGRELILLLLGINTPSEFTQALTEEAKLAQQTVSSIMQDVNTQIFIPLREQMRSSGSQASASPQRPPAPPVPVPSRPVVASGVVRPPPQSPRYFHLENKLPAPRPVQPPVAVRPPASVSQTDSRKLLEDHKEPSPSLKATEGTAHIEFSKAPVTPAETPLRQALRAVAPPPNLPGALRPTETFGKGGMPPSPTPPPPPAPPASAPAAGIDPYREPI